MVATLKDQIVEQLESLDEQARARVLAFTKGVAGRKLPPPGRGSIFAEVIAERGAIADEDACIMLEASRECRRVDPRGW